MNLSDFYNMSLIASKVIQSKPFGFSFNVSDRCPVNCDCYWRAMGRVKELEADEMVAFFEARRQEGYVHVNLVGGEPYVHLKSDLLERLTATMPSNWITTSGVTPLKHLPKTLHFVSIDGADAETHDRVRGFPGLYDRIVRHLSEARANGFFPACLHVTLNTLNYQQVPRILNVWLENELVDGVAFSTHTPIRDASDDWLRLSEVQTWQLVANLLRCKKEHAGFLLNTEAMIRRLHPQVMNQQSPATCATSCYVASFHADGKQIEQCIFSEKGDCSHCGCVVTTALDSIMEMRAFDFETARMLRRLLPPFA